MKLFRLPARSSEYSQVGGIVIVSPFHDIVAQMTVLLVVSLSFHQKQARRFLEHGFLLVVSFSFHHSWYCSSRDIGGFATLGDTDTLTCCEQRPNVAKSLGTKRNH